MGRAAGFLAWSKAEVQVAAWRWQFLCANDAHFEIASVGFPAAVDATGENLPIRGNGQAYLAGGDRAAAVGQKSGEEVGDDGGRETRGVGVDEKKQRLVAE